MASRGVLWTPSDKAAGSRKIGLELFRQRLQNTRTGLVPASILWSIAERPSERSPSCLVTKTIWMMWIPMPLTTFMTIAATAFWLRAIATQKLLTFTLRGNHGQENAPNILTTHPKYTAMLKKWEQIRDVLGGEEAVKNKCTYGLQKYLPLPDTENDTQKNMDRYASYVLRAVFYNATARTLSGLVGQVFSKPPVTTFPDSVDYLKEDPAGSGVTLEQHAKGVLAEIMAMGRAGLWVDYPQVEGGVTKAEAELGLIRPTSAPMP